MANTRERYCVEDLRKERASCNFNQEELTNLIDGGKEFTDFRRKINASFLNDPAYDDEIPPDYLSHEDRYSNELRKACHTFLKLRNENYTMEEFQSYGPTMLLKDGNPLALHMGMFYDALKGQCTEEQQQRWLGRVKRGEIIGTYAQTELGHGTFVRGLETTATYDLRTQEFVLHSPTITSTKWWPGCLGKTSSYAVVMAQLYSKGKCYGPHPFFVQLRDEKTHRSMPGVTLGEIGPRAGLNTNDNGFLRFNNYRIPRTNMLMKHSQVLKDGTYVKPGHAKLAYGTMVVTRVSLIFHSYKQLQRAVTIATRYSAVRRQSEMVPGEPEPQILDYQTQQYKLLPHIASIFALLFSARSCLHTYGSATANMDMGVMFMLPELHALSCGLKALSSDDATEGVETCRLACGGHGYLCSSNFPRIYGGTTCIMTYEGENTVMWLQVARYLIKSYRAARDGTILQKSVAYLGSKPKRARSTNLSDEALVEAFKMAAAAKISATEARINRLVESGQKYQHAWNNCLVSLVKCAQAHIRYYVCDTFLKNVLSLQASQGVTSILRNLCRLYLIYHITLNEGDFLICDALSASDVEQLEQEMGELLALLRPQAVNIVDAFDIDDKVLSSTLGCWDGNVYQRLYDEALKSPLNKSDVPKAYYKYLQPLMQSGMQAKL